MLLPPALLPALVGGFVVTFAVLPASRETFPYAAAVVALVTALAIPLLLWASGSVLWSRAPMRMPRLLLAIPWGGLVLFVLRAFNDRSLLTSATTDWRLGRSAEVGALLLLCTYLPAIVWGRDESPRFSRTRFAAFALLTLIAGIETIRIAPLPTIDVWTIQNAGATALEHFQNPYTTVTQADTGNLGDLTVPYVYPPTHAILSLLGDLLGGDVRFTMLLAILIAGLCLRDITRRSGWPLPSFVLDAPVLLFWLTPKLFFILEQGWIDPIQLALFALSINAHLARRPMLTAALLGLTVSSKQSMIWLIPMGAVMLQFGARQWLVAAATGAAAAIPFALLDFTALRHAVIDFELSLPPRPDAITVNVWAARAYHIAIPGAVGTGLAALVTVLSSWFLRRRGVAGLGIAAAATYLVFFAFNKWAFANYYFLVVGLCATAAATAFHAMPARASVQSAPEDKIRASGT